MVRSKTPTKRLRSQLQEGPLDPEEGEMGVSSRGESSPGSRKHMAEIALQMHSNKSSDDGNINKVENEGWLLRWGSCGRGSDVDAAAAGRALFKGLANTSLFTDKAEMYAGDGLLISAILL